MLRSALGETCLFSTMILSITKKRHKVKRQFILILSTRQNIVVQNCPRVHKLISRQYYFETWTTEQWSFYVYNLQKKHYK